MTTETMTISSGTVDKLNRAVERIEANPGRFIDPREMSEANETVDVSHVIESLPDGITREDFVDILRLAMLTECATESYAAVFRRGADEYDAPWLARFTNRTWVPDELCHATPFKEMLLTLGFSEDQLDREMADVQASHYEHCCGVSPVELTTYGMIQEQLTDQWHGLIAKVVKPGAPHAAHMANRVKGRETLHTMWYRELTAIQVADQPELLGPVADTIMSFEMPGRQLIPELQGRALKWMPMLRVDFTHVARELVRNFSTVAGSTRGAGELLTNVAIRRGYPIGPIPLRSARTVLSQWGGFGYKILGEAIKERVGLLQEAPGSRFNPLDRMRSSVRSFVARRIDLRAVTGETSAA